MMMMMMMVMMMMMMMMMMMIRKRIPKEIFKRNPSQTLSGKIILQRSGRVKIKIWAKDQAGSQCQKQTCDFSKEMIAQMQELHS